MNTCHQSQGPDQQAIFSGLTFGKLTRKIAIRLIRFLFDKENLYGRILLAPHSFAQSLDVQQLKNALVSAKKDIPYYRDNFPELKYDLPDAIFLQQFKNTDFEINKKILKEDIKKFLNPELFKKENIMDYKKDSFFSVLRKLFKNFLVPISTSGSTGIPLYFYKSKTSAMRVFYKMAYVARYFGWREGENISYIQQRGTMPYMDTVRKYASIVGLSLFCPDVIDEKSTMEFVRFLKNKRPTVLYGFPSILSEYALIIKNNKLPIKSSLKFIMSGSEILFENQRKLLQEVFNCPVYNFYGAIEIGIIASECGCQDGLHIFEDSVFLENNQNGEIIITTLAQEEMPLIKYNIGDRGRIMEETCSCGLMGKKIMIQEIEGRVEEYLVDNSGGKIYGSYFRQLILVANEKFEDKIINSQIIQKPNREIEYKLQLRNQFDPQSPKIIDYITKNIGQKMQIDVSGSIIKSLNVGKKLKFLVRES